MGQADPALEQVVREHEAWVKGIKSVARELRLQHAMEDLVAHGMAGKLPGMCIFEHGPDQTNECVESGSGRLTNPCFVCAGPDYETPHPIADGDAIYHLTDADALCGFCEAPGVFHVSGRSASCLERFCSTPIPGVTACP